MMETGADGSSASWSTSNPRSGRVTAFSHAIFWMALMLLWPAGTLGLRDSGETPEDRFVVSKLLATDGMRGDELGWSVATDGDILVVGAVNAETAGRVYVFVRDEQGWKETAVLRPTGNVPNASFGNAVDLDGEILVVGAPRDREAGAEVGAAYVFRGTGGQWQMDARVVAGDGAAGDRFGESVSIHGERFAVGAPSRNEGGEKNAGAVYLFAAADGLWTQEARLVADGRGTGGLFGTAVALYDGIIVVGAPTDTAILNAPGVSYVFERHAERWAQTARLTGPGSQRDLFGISVDVSARTIVVGAPRAAPTLPARPGGSVHVFEETDSRWLEQAKLLAPDTTSGDRFGFSVSVSGGTIVASTVELCSVSVFHRNGIAWLADSILEAGDGCQASFGRAVDVRGDTILAGSPSDGDRGNAAGAAYVFETSNEEVILGPGTQAAVAGEEMQLYLTLDSRAADVVSFRLDILLPPEITFDSENDADCRLEKDLAGDFALSTIVSSDPFGLRIEVTSLRDPPDPLPRDGLIGRCRARVDQDVAPGTRSLACGPDGTAAATGTDGEALPSRCADGELTILPPCIGDCDGSGVVSVDELLFGIRLALDSEPVGSCRAFDRNRDRSISVDELVGAVSAALGGCGDL